MSVRTNTWPPIPILTEFNIVWNKQTFSSLLKTVFSFVQVYIFQQYFKNPGGGVELTVPQTWENYFMYFEMHSSITFLEPVKVTENLYTRVLWFSSFAFFLESVSFWKTGLFHTLKWTEASSMPYIMPHSIRLVLCKMNRAMNAVCTYTVMVSLCNASSWHSCIKWQLSQSCQKTEQSKYTNQRSSWYGKTRSPKIKFPSPPSNALPVKGTWFSLLEPWSLWWTLPTTCQQQTAEDICPEETEETLTQHST